MVQNFTCAVVEQIKEREMLSERQEGRPEEIYPVCYPALVGVHRKVGKEKNET